MPQLHRILVISIVLIAGLIVPADPAAASAESHCDPLPAATGAIVNVDTEAELQNAVRNLTSGTTILIADGTYDLTNTLNFRGVTNVAMRSASGNRNSVVLKGRGMSNTNYGNVPHVTAVYDSKNVQIADLTMRDAYFHLIQVHGEADADGVNLYNVHMVDAGEQFLKGSTGGGPGPYADDGVVACSLFEYTDRARSDYTNAIDVLAGSNWVIRDNVFRNIRAPRGQLAGPTILMWRNSLDTIVERNLFIECDRGIALGLSAPDANSRDGETVYDHQGGVIRNNMIYREGPGDIGIAANYSSDVEISHNTIIQNDTFKEGTIQYRFSSTSARIFNNLVDGPIWDRGGSATLSGNLIDPPLDWFVNPSSGDLHLTAAAVGAIDKAGPLVGAIDDYDGALRPVGAGPDIGADEYGSDAPLPTSGFRDVRPGHLFESDIIWLAGEGITKGCNPPINDLYCPDDAVTREQMATFLVRALALPSSANSPFSDISASVHLSDINALAAAGITKGCNPPTNSLFCPTDRVTRDQMAAFLVRAMKLTNDGGGNGFVDDDGSVFEVDIAKLAAAGITRGCNPPTNDRFCPSNVVTRGEMAAFLHRALG